jgi:tetratricopeptide (TPR) repeat protein
MKKSTIEELAYQIKQAKDEGLPKPIVFLGAGASKTGGIPLACEIVEEILDRYKNNPKIKSIQDEDKTYPKLMECLTPYERNKLLKEYVESAKINVAHIYLAQLLNQSYIDYVLTVNFDNLIIRALALYNDFPPLYDMAVLKDLTTTNFKEKSVLYLHGQHHGLWLLNTDEELSKVQNIIPPIFNKITNQRPWIFLGYSGEDPIFKHIVNLGRFDNGLFWVTYYDNNPNETVCEDLIKKPNTNAYLITGYDADSFMLKLNKELELPQPTVIDKPFSSLKHSLENIVDIDDKEHFKGVKERLEIVKKEVDKAIQQFEEGNIEAKEDLKEEVDVNLLKKQIIDKIIKEDYKEGEIIALEEIADNLKNEEINNKLAGLFNNWGTAFFKLAKLKNDQTLFEKSFEKYKKATALNPQYDSAYDNWGTALFELAKLKNDQALFEKSFEKYEKATALNPKYDSAYNNWGAALSELAKLKNDEALFEKSFEKLNIAIELGFSHYNLACFYAFKKDKINALKLLEICLKNKEIKVQFVRDDDDWKELWLDEDFLNLINKY